MKEKLKQLDEDISTKLIKLSNKYPIVSYQYLVEIQKVCEWAKIIQSSEKGQMGIQTKIGKI